MDNQEFLSVLARKSGFDSKTTATLAESLVSEFIAPLTSLDTISVPCFGEFGASKTEERIADDPVTGERLLFPPMIEICFTPHNLSE